MALPKGKLYSLPTIHFQERAVSFREGNGDENWIPAYKYLQILVIGDNINAESRGFPTITDKLLLLHQENPQKIKEQASFD